LEVQDHRALVGVVVPEIERPVGAGNVVDEGADGAGGGTAGRFDFDHVGAHVGKEFSSELAELVAQFDDAEAGEGAAHMKTPSSSCSVNSVIKNLS